MKIIKQDAVRDVIIFDDDKFDIPKSLLYKRERHRIGYSWTYYDSFAHEWIYYPAGEELEKKYKEGLRELKLQRITSPKGRL